MSTFTPKISRRGIYYFAEVATAPGPQAIAVTGDNSFGALFGREWLLVLARDTSLLHLHQESSTADGTWVEVTADLPPAFDVALEVDARRITFAFDQSARIIIAYETGGIVKVTRWDTSLNAYIQNVSFAGHDPVVVIDATWAYNVTVSDVLLFYLSTDRERVIARVQRDIYSTEYEMHDYGTPVVLDRVTRFPLRYQILVSDAAGDPLEFGGERVGLLSDLYPYPALDEAEGVGLPATAGVYVLVILTESGENAVQGLAQPATGGTYAEPVILTDGLDDLIGDGVPATGGAYISVLILTDRLDAVTGGSSPTTGGVYTLVVLTTDEGPDAISGTASPATGGTYATA